MSRYLIKIFSRGFQRERILMVCERSEDQAKVMAASSQGSLMSEIHSVIPAEKLTLLEVPERHPRLNWKCFKFKEWPYYKADLDITDPENSIMVSCFDPTEFCPEDQETFKELILQRIPK